MKEKILELEEVAQRYNESILKTVTEKQFADFVNWSPVELSIEIQMELKQLYELANGFEFNGLIIYSLDKECDNNIYNLNEVWHENEGMESYLFIGDADISWYCYNSSDGLFCELDKPSGRLMNEYKNLQELIVASISTII